MPRPTKPKKVQPNPTSQNGVRKSSGLKKNKRSHQATPSLVKGLLSEKYFAEFEQQVTEQRDVERTLLLPESDKAILEVFKLGTEVFESTDKFISWLNRGNISLDGKMPLKLLMSKKAQIVRDELLRMIRVNRVK